jgi:hypothetical protein
LHQVAQTFSRGTFLHAEQAGRLTILSKHERQLNTYLHYSNSLVTYIHKPSEEQKKAEGVYDYEADFHPQWAFRHGLSYTTFSYSQLASNKPSINQGENLQVSYRYPKPASVKARKWCTSTPQTSMPATLLRM